GRAGNDHPDRVDMVIGRIRRVEHPAHAIETDLTLDARRQLGLQDAGSFEIRGLRPDCWLGRSGRVRYALRMAKNGHEVSSPGTMGAGNQLVSSVSPAPGPSSWANTWLHDPSRCRSVVPSQPHDYNGS